MRIHHRRLTRLEHYALSDKPDSPRIKAIIVNLREPTAEELPEYEKFCAAAEASVGANFQRMVEWPPPGKPGADDIDEDPPEDPD